MYVIKSAALNAGRVRRESRDYGTVTTCEGYLSRPEVDSDNDLIEAGAWDDAKADAVALCWQHDLKSPIGKWCKLEVRSDGLYGQAEISEEFELGKQAAALVRQGALSGLSVGFNVPNRSQNILEKEMDVGGRKRRVRTIKKATLIECSLVTRPALESARITRAATDYMALKGAGLTPREIDLVLASRECAACQSQSDDPVALGEAVERLLHSLRSSA